MPSLVNARELSLVLTMRLKTLLASSPSTVMVVQTSYPSTALTNAKASNCSLNWGLMKNSTSKFLLLTWRKTNQALLTRSHLVSHTIKLMISLRERPLMLKRKPLSKAGGIRQLISATCQLLFLMTFGNKRIAPDDSETVRGHLLHLYSSKIKTRRC